MLLTTIVPSLSIWNIWDLPVWAWRGYAALHDDYVRRMKEADRG